MALRFATFCFSLTASCDVDIVKEKTLAMVKPDEVDGKFVDAIKNIILDWGFSIVQDIERRLAEDTVKSFYAEHASKSFFSNLVQYMTSGPVRIMVLEKENAVADWCALIGPTDAEKAKMTHPERLAALHVSERFVASAQKETVFTVQIRHNLLPERYLFFFQKSSSSGTVSKHDEL